MTIAVPAPRIGKYAGGTVAKLSTQQRKKLPAKSFAGPDRSFPINDASHARNALARVATRSPALKARVRSAVHRKYPTMGKQPGPGLMNR